mgnify:CR=1 FL=1
MCYLGNGSYNCIMPFIDQTTSSPNSCLGFVVDFLLSQYYFGEVSLFSVPSHDILLDRRTWRVHFAMEKLRTWALQTTTWISWILCWLSWIKRARRGAGFCNEPSKQSRTSTSTTLPNITNKILLNHPSFSCTWFLPTAQEFLPAAKRFHSADL